MKSLKRDILKQVAWGLILLFLLSGCQSPKYSITLRNETYYAMAGITIQADKDYTLIANPQGSQTVTLIPEGVYGFTIAATSTIDGSTLYYQSGNVDLDRDRTCIFYWDGYNYNHRWE